MATEHVDITDPEIHEPKGAATASARQTYEADGLGSGGWKHSSHSCHGEMVIINNATATAVTAAVDATLNTDTDYVKVTAGWTDPHVHNMTFNVDELVTTINGHYHLSFWASVLVPTTNNFVGVKFAINDATPYSIQKIKTQSVSANDYRNLFAVSNLDLTAGDTISIYIAASKTDNIVIEEAGVDMVLLHEA